MRINNGEDLITERKEYDKAYYQGKDSNYIFGYKNLKAKIFWRRRIKLLRKTMQSGRLLDLGCAFGFFIKIIEKDYEAYGVDISQYSVDQAKKIVSNPERIKRFDINRGIPFEQDFDIITALDILEHVKDPLVVFKLINQCLKDEGSFYLELPLAKTLIDRDKGHVYRKLEIWLNFLSQAGFKPEIVKTYYTVGLRGFMLPSKHLINYCSIIAKKTNQSPK